MAAERLDLQSTTNNQTPGSARLAAEASLRAALTAPLAESREGRRSKKRKRNKNRGRERTIIHADSQPVAKLTQEGALNLAIPHEGEIDMHQTVTPKPARDVERSSTNHETGYPKQDTIVKPVSERVAQKVNEAYIQSVRTESTPPVPPGFQEFNRILMGQDPALEAKPLHQYPVHELSSRATIMPTSMETRTIGGRPLSKTAETYSNQASSRPEAAELPNKLMSEMSRSELVKIAKGVKIDGVRLSEVFDAKRIDQEGLRAIVETFLRGGDVRKQLMEELVAKEQSFERDPHLRHQRSTKRQKPSRLGVLATTAATGAKVLFEQHGSQLAATSQKQVKKAGKVLANGAKMAQHDIIDNSNITDWLSITAIVIVWSLILILLLR